MTIRLCRACGDWHDPDIWPAECLPDASAARSSFPTPMVASDTLNMPLQSMATGNWHTSKAAMRQEYRDHGMIEIGNEKIRPKPQKIDSKAEAVTALKKHGIIS